MTLTPPSASESVITSLSQSEDVDLDNQNDIPIISLVEPDIESEQSTEYLDDEGYTILKPDFGNPTFLSVSPESKMEVYNILASFQPLTDASFNSDATPFPFIEADVSTCEGGFQFHEVIPSIAVLSEIQTLQKFSAKCPVLAALPAGAPICDIKCSYENINVTSTIRLCKC